MLATCREVSCRCCGRGATYKKQPNNLNGKEMFFAASFLVTINLLILCLCQRAACAYVALTAGLLTRLALLFMHVWLLIALRFLWQHKMFTKVKKKEIL